VRAVAEATSAVPLDAQVLEADQSPLETAPLARPANTASINRTKTAEMVDAKRAALMAMGGTVASLVLGVFAAALGTLWPPAALIAILGLAMGIWGLRSPRRNLALIGMLLCCLAIGIGAFGGVRAIYLQVQNRRAIELAP
jgi:hypothetical protein